MLESSPELFNLESATHIATDDRRTFRPAPCSCPAEGVCQGVTRSRPGSALGQLELAANNAFVF